MSDLFKEFSSKHCDITNTKAFQSQVSVLPLKHCLPVAANLFVSITNV